MERGLLMLSMWRRCRVNDDLSVRDVSGFAESDMQVVHSLVRRVASSSRNGSE